MSQVVPNWKTDKENPIYKYVPTTEQPFNNDSDVLFNSELHAKLASQSIREQKLLDLVGKDRSSGLLLAGTIALKNAKTSPWQIMKEREGFVTKFHVPTILDTKTSMARTKHNELDPKTGEVLKPKEQPYENPRDHQFRDLELRFNQKDFVSRVKGAPAYNPNFLSEFNSLPQTTYARERKANEAEEERKREEYLRQLKGDRAFNPDWVQYHKLPEKLVPMTVEMKDTYLPKRLRKPKDQSEFLPKDDYMTGY